jgi:hypothetical protein
MSRRHETTKVVASTTIAAVDTAADLDLQADGKGSSGQEYVMVADYDVFLKISPTTPSGVATTDELWPRLVPKYFIARNIGGVVDRYLGVRSIGLDTKITVSRIIRY